MKGTEGGEMLKSNSGIQNTIGLPNGETFQAPSPFKQTLSQGLSTFAQNMPQQQEQDAPVPQAGEIRRNPFIEDFLRQRLGNRGTY